MVTIKLVLVLASNNVLNKDDRYGPDRMHQVNTQRADFTYKRLVRFCCQSEIGERILGLRTCYASPYCQPILGDPQVCSSWRRGLEGMRQKQLTN